MERPKGEGWIPLWSTLLRRTDCKGGGVLAGEDRGIGDREGWGYVDAVRGDDEVAVDALAVLEGEGGGVVVDGGDAVAEVDGDGGAGAGGGGGDVFEAAVEIDAVDVLPGLAGV